MTRVFISVGSNIDREQNIVSALNILKEKYPDFEVSPIYESEAVGFDGEPFYNLVIGFDTQESPSQLVEYLHQVEKNHGRERTAERFVPRTLDLDLLTYGEQIVNKNGLQIPRHEILLYAFVLLPLAELAPDGIHPEIHKTYRQLWHAFDQKKQSLRQIQLSVIE